jgi:two-component system, NtrC family, sensor kinase
MELYQQISDVPADITKQAKKIDLPFLLQDLPKLLSSMQIGADRIQEIVKSLRTFSRKDESELKQVDIHEGLDSTLLILRNRLKEQPHRSEIELTKDYCNLPLVECYPGPLNQVFMNILSNAIDALDERCEDIEILELENENLYMGGYMGGHTAGIIPKIHVSTQLILDVDSTELDVPRLEIRISDNGIGIPEVIQQRIFDPFFTTKPVGKGTGMGMSISYQIITEKHQGLFRCESSPGQGTTFVIEIPVSQKRVSEIQQFI